MQQVLSLYLLVTMAASVCFGAETAPASEAAPPPGSRELCVISDERIKESSGIALSRRQPDAVWIHNDSGDAARFFFVGLDGKTRGVVRLRAVRPLDWEDMCAFVADQTPWLLAGDIGDNEHNRSLTGKGRRACCLLLFPEPEMKDASEREAEAPTVIQFEYEDGPRNCESVAVDAARGEILLVSKSKGGPSGIAGVYRMPLTLAAGTTTATAQRIAGLDVAMITAMDISPDGRRMVILAPGSALCVDRDENEAWGDALKRPPRIIPLPKRKNGETVCFGRDRNELLLNSEYAGQPLWSVTRPDMWPFDKEK